ncbi:MAG: TetR family transcriptional regulator [Frankiales bacterium]|nr:TetR family transcriptional regulator [Frankiales bacterium]
MARWEPDARGRLAVAALDLFEERGYDDTTVADIAERAGVTARTFFRHFPDKKEVLFSGSDRLQEGLVAAAEDAARTGGALDAVAATLDVAAELLGADRDFSRRRHAVVSANAELRERELIKMSRIADGLAAALGRQGIPTADARLAAESGIAVLRVSFEQWVAARRGPALAALMRTNLGRLTDLAAAAAGAAPGADPRRHGRPGAGTR